jgi:60 kDa SS-A/Ro ribonucleoprotein
MPKRSERLKGTQATIGDAMDALLGTRTPQVHSTPQDQPIAGTAQVPNWAGGYAWKVDSWSQLDRFLILGTKGGTYYATERTVTHENMKAVAECLAIDGLRTVQRIVDISDAGRAPKNTYALFALAMAASAKDADTRYAAFNALPKVARIGTHLFQFLKFVSVFRGWGRGLRNAVAKWYERKPLDKLALQAVKYRQREGWTHRDALRLAHPRTPHADRNALLQWIVDPEKVDVNLPGLVIGYERAQRATTAGEWSKLVREYRLPREALPTEAFKYITVWEALLHDMPMTAMIRNLGKMTSIGLIKPGSAATQKVVAALHDEETLRKARVHPIQILAALTAYAGGQSVRASRWSQRTALQWEPVPQVTDALDGAFYKTFSNVEPTGQRWLLALDVSGSMDMGEVSQVPGLTPRVASAAMALVTAAVEPNYSIMAFAHNFVKLSISPRQRLDDVLSATDALSFGGTDCALPMVYAMRHKLEVDTFVIYTDSETWAGRIHGHPAEALWRYRSQTGIPAKLVVVGMVANPFTIADPRDLGMMDVVGFDTATPQIISQFSAEGFGDAAQPILPGSPAQLEG